MTNNIEVTGDPIPINRIRQFTEILGATGGRYLRNPIKYGEVYRVDYVPGDYNLQNKRWNRVNTDIKEVRKDQVWRTIIRRLNPLNWK